MTAIYSLAPVNDTNAALTAINTNTDGLETAVGTQADTANVAGSLLARLAAIAGLVDGLKTAIGTTGDAASTTGSLLARLGSIAGFVDGLEGFTDGIEGVLGTAVASPTANTINANLLRTMRVASNCSTAATVSGSTAVAAAGGTASTLASSAAAGTDWRRISIYNNGSVNILLAIGAAATATAYTMPVPAGYLLTLETLLSLTALSSADATNVLVTIET